MSDAERAGARYLPTHSTPSIGSIAAVAPFFDVKTVVVDGSRGSGSPPVAGVRLVARSEIPMPQAEKRPFEIERTGTTDASGVVVFRDLPTRGVRVPMRND